MQKFITQNQDYIIELYKEPVLFSFDNSLYSNYNCHIRFLNNINQVLLDLVFTEKEYLNFINELNDFNINIGNVLDNMIHLSTKADFNNYFIFLMVDNGDLKDNPVEEDFMISIQIFESGLQGNKTRLYFELSYFFLEELAYLMYLEIEDIPYIQDMQSSMLSEFISNYENQIGV